VSTSPKKGAKIGKPSDESVAGVYVDKAALKVTLPLLLAKTCV